MLLPFRRTVPKTTTVAVVAKRVTCRADMAAVREVVVVVMAVDTAEGLRAIYSEPMGTANKDLVTEEVAEEKVLAQAINKAEEEAEAVLAQAIKAAEEVVVDFSEPMDTVSMDFQEAAVTADTKLMENTIICSELAVMASTDSVVVPGSMASVVVIPGSKALVVGMVVVIMVLAIAAMSTVRDVVITGTRAVIRTVSDYVFIIFQVNRSK